MTRPETFKDTKIPYATSLPIAMQVRQMVNAIETAIALTGL